MSATEACQAHYKSLSGSLWAAQSLRPLLAQVKRPRALDPLCWIVWARPIWLPARQASINHMQHDTLPLFLQCKHILSFWCSDWTMVFIWHLPPNLSWNIDRIGIKLIKQPHLKSERMMTWNIWGRILILQLKYNWSNYFNLQASLKYMKV